MLRITAQELGQIADFDVTNVKMTIPSRKRGGDLIILLKSRFCFTYENNVKLK